MDINVSEVKSAEVYHLLTQTIIPRPIAWILTESTPTKGAANPSYNLAPFSFFNAMASSPPTLIISIGRKPNGEDKDTRTNLTQGSHCVVHIPSLEHAQLVSESSRTFEYGDSELDALGINVTEFVGFALPRLADAPVAYGCRVAEVIEWGSTPQALILLEIEQAFIDGSVIEHDAKGRLHINAQALNPLARLGANEYAALGDIVKIDRPV